MELVAEEDNRMFPVSNDSITIVDCLLNTSRRLGVEILKQTNIKEVKKVGEVFHLSTDDNEYLADQVIVAQGGSNKEDSYRWLKALNHNIEFPVPSLFTFNMPSEKVKEFPGVVVKNVSTKVLSTKLKSQGDLLITHWGMSGPAILKLSAWGSERVT